MYILSPSLSLFLCANYFLFPVIQKYMGDFPVRQAQSRDTLVTDLLKTAIAQVQLRDEIYIQLCKQTTDNPSL